MSTEVDPANCTVSSGMNTAVNGWVPIANTGAGVNVTALLAGTVTAPRLAVPSLNCTLPDAGVPLASVGRLTVADIIVGFPASTGEEGLTFSTVMDALGL